MLPCVCFTCLECSCCCVMFCAAKSQHVRETVNMFAAMDFTNLIFCFLSSGNQKIMNTEHSLRHSVSVLNFDSSTQYDWIQVRMCASEPSMQYCTSWSNARAQNLQCSKHTADQKESGFLECIQGVLYTSMFFRFVNLWISYTFLLLWMFNDGRRSKWIECAKKSTANYLHLCYKSCTKN
jgi:hypothetical protein